MLAVELPCILIQSHTINSIYQNNKCFKLNRHGPVTARPRMLCRTCTREMHYGIEIRWQTVNKTIVKLALHLSVFWCGKQTEKLGTQPIGDFNC